LRTRNSDQPNSVSRSLMKVIQMKNSVGGVFNFRKATQALNYFARQGGGKISKIKALKLVYLADRYHLRKYGRLITNDSYFAMEFGPVPSGVKDIAQECSDFLSSVEQPYASEYIKPIGTSDFKSIQPVDENVFSDSDLEAIRYIWDHFSAFQPFELSEISHSFPEWSKHRKTLDMVSRVPIDITDFFEESGTELDRHFESDSISKELFKQGFEENTYLEALWK